MQCSAAQCSAVQCWKRRCGVPALVMFREMPSFWQESRWLRWLQEYYLYWIKDVSDDQDSKRSHTKCTKGYFQKLLYGKRYIIIWMYTSTMMMLTSIAGTTHEEKFGNHHEIFDVSASRKEGRLMLIFNFRYTRMTYYVERVVWCLLAEPTVGLSNPEDWLVMVGSWWGWSRDHMKNTPSRELLYIRSWGSSLALSVWDSSISLLL